MATTKQLQRNLLALAIGEAVTRGDIILGDGWLHRRQTGRLDFDELLGRPACLFWLSIDPGDEMRVTLWWGMQSGAPLLDQDTGTYPEVTRRLGRYADAVQSIFLDIEKRRLALQPFQTYICLARCKRVQLKRDVPNRVTSLGFKF